MIPHCHAAMTDQSYHVNAMLAFDKQFHQAKKVGTRMVVPAVLTPVEREMPDVIYW